MKTPHRLIIIQTDGKVIETQVQKKPELSQIQSVVGGYVEVINHISYEKYTCQMLVDEDGRSKGYLPNGKATQIFNNSFGIKKVIPIVGNVCIIMGWRF